jgi:chaperonin GroEL (HSP60 family)
MESLRNMRKELFNFKVNVVVTCERIPPQVTAILKEDGVYLYDNVSRTDIFALSDHLGLSMQNPKISQDSFADCTAETIKTTESSILLIKRLDDSPFCTLILPKVDLNDEVTSIENFKKILSRILERGAIETVVGAGSIELQLSRLIRDAEKDTDESLQLIYRYISNSFQIVTKTLLLNANKSLGTELPPLITDCIPVQPCISDLYSIVETKLKATREIVEMILSLDCIFVDNPK